MNPSRGPSEPTDPVRRFDLLVVGTMNVCRSPAAEQLLRARLPDAGVNVRSAGTRAADGIPVPEPLTSLLGHAGLAAREHPATQLQPEMVASADLVLTTSRAERAAVVRLVPGALRRTFTLRELARVAHFLGPTALPDGDAVERLRALVPAAEPHRGPTAPPVPAYDDVLDPYGDDERAYEASFAQLRAAVDAIAATVHAGEPPEHEESVPLEVHPVAVRRRSRTRDVALVAIASVVALVVAATVGVLVVLDRLDSRIERFPDPFAGLPTRPAPFVPEEGEPPVTVLVLGSGDAVQDDGWAQAAAVTDVVMLARVAADRQSAQLVAMPPDMWVDVPGSGPGALRSALARGGPPAAVQTVEQLTDVRVDHVALTDSTAFAEMTDALGGVDLQVGSDVVVDGQVRVAAGEGRLTGERALLWAQAAEDDAERADRQQAWLRAILDRLSEPDARRDPTSWLRLLDVVSGSVAVDEGLDRGTMLGLLTSMRGMAPGDVEVVAAPTTTGTTGAGASVLVPDEEPFDALMDAMRTDTLGEHLSGTG